MSTETATARDRSVILTAFFAVVGLAIGWMQLSAWRYTIGWDTVSYIEIADQVCKGHFSELFGSYWSPLFPCLIALLKVGTGPAFDQFLLIALAMFISFAMALAAFIFFANQLMTVHSQLIAEEADTVTPSTTLMLTVLYISFLFCSLGISELSHKTPDVLAAAITFFVLGQWLTLLQGKQSAARYGLIGFLTGLAYWAKNFNLGWGPVFILSLILLGGKCAPRGKKLAALLATYIIMMVSLAVPISLKAGHFTFSDVVKVGCAWSETVGYMGIVHGRGESFVHPTREFFSQPAFYEFATPFEDVTYPPFYAPQYWYEGVKFKFDPASYAAKMAQKFMYFGEALGFCLTVSLTIMSLRGGANPIALHRLKIFAPGIVPSIFGLFVLFFMLDPEGRYYLSSLAPFMAFFVASLSLPPGDKSKSSFKISLILLNAWMILILTVKTWMHFYFAFPAYSHWLADLTKVPMPPSPAFSQHRANIKGLAEAGLKPGDRIARITRCGDGEFYWAKGSHLKIVCETASVDTFWQSSPEQRLALYKKLKAFGVKAIVQDWCPPSKSDYPEPSDPGWKRIPETKTYYLLL